LGAAREVELILPWLARIFGSVVRHAFPVRLAERDMSWGDDWAPEGSRGPHADDGAERGAGGTPDKVAGRPRGRSSALPSI